MKFQIVPTQIGQVLRRCNDDSYEEYILTDIINEGNVVCTLLRDIQRNSSNPDLIERHTFKSGELTVLADSLEKYVQSWNSKIARPNSLKAYFIENIDDVKRYLSDVHAIYDHEFHPDDDFKDFKNENDETTFTTREAEYLNAIMIQCFDICDKNEVEIYDIAGEVQVNIWKKKGLWPKS